MKWRFFYHFNKRTKAMTVHFRGACIPTKHVQCKVPCESKYNKTQPFLVMRGFAKRARKIYNTVVID